MFDLLQPRLADVAAWQGIVPVPNQVLEDHKRAELRKHRGSWWYHHAILGTFCLITGVIIAMALACVSGTTSICYMSVEKYLSAAEWAALCAICIGIISKIVATGVLSSGFRVYGPAKWWEEEVGHVYGLDAPAPIRKLAERIMRTNTTDDMKMVCGRLTRGHVIIDPYLVIRRGDDQIVLGIWDDNQIIAQAVMD